jgi:hypothetical protein
VALIQNIGELVQSVRVVEDVPVPGTSEETIKLQSIGGDEHDELEILVKQASETNKLPIDAWVFLMSKSMLNPDGTIMCQNGDVEQLRKLPVPIMIYFDAHIRRISKLRQVDFESILGNLLSGQTSSSVTD